MIRYGKAIIISITILLFYGCQNQKASNELENLKAQITAEQQSIEKHKAIVIKAHEEVWSKGNTELIDTLYSDNYIAHWSVGGDMSKEGLKQMIVETRKIFPDLKEEIVQIIAEGDLVVTYFTSSGTMKSAMHGIPPTDKSASRPEIAIHRIENGKIAEQWTVADRLSLLEQLGIQL